MREKGYTNEEIGNMVYQLGNKLSGGHLDDKPSSATKIELEKLKKDLEGIDRIEKKLDKFVDGSDKKYASKEITESELENLNKRVDGHDEIFKRVMWTILTAVILAILSLVIINNK